MGKGEPIEGEVTARRGTPKRTVDAASIAVAKSGWAHNPYAAPDSDNARIAAISNQFIELFYKALLKKHCRVATGVEMETGFIYPGQSYSNAKDAMIEYLNDQIVKPDASGKKRNGIYYVYDDTNCMEVTTWPQKPMQTVKHVVAVKKLLLESTAEFQELAPNHTPSTSAAKLAKAAPSQKLRFGEAKEGREDGILFGEHLNISLHHTNEDTPSHSFDLASNNRTNTEFDGYNSLLSEVLEEYTRADALLLLHSSKSEDRMQTRYKGYQKKATNFPGENCARGIQADKGEELEDEEARRVEWQRPDSGSDIHLTMLTAMAAIYAMVKATCEEHGTENMPRHRRPFSKLDIEARMNILLPMPKKEEVAETNEGRIAQFEKQSMVLKMMKQLVQDAVPAEEQEKYLGMIEEFKTVVIAQSRQQFAKPSPPRNPSLFAVF